MNFLWEDSKANTSQGQKSLWTEQNELNRMEAIALGAPNLTKWTIQTN